MSNPHPITVDNARASHARAAVKVLDNVLKKRGGVLHLSSQLFRVHSEASLVAFVHRRECAFLNVGVLCRFIDFWWWQFKWRWANIEVVGCFVGVGYWDSHFQLLSRIGSLRLSLLGSRIPMQYLGTVLLRTISIHVFSAQIWSFDFFSPCISYIRWCR